MRFSQRIGKAPIKSIQLDSMDDDLRNNLWNVFRNLFLKKLSPGDLFNSEFHREIVFNFYKLPLDKVSALNFIEFIRKRFFNGEPFIEVYDLLDFCIGLNNLPSHIYKDELVNALNFVLERELSGYRFINYQLVPVTNQNEIASIEGAIDNTATSKLIGVHVHLETALSKLADRKNPDYRNCIKESISAVESIAKIISEDPKATLAPALTKVKAKINIHPALETGFKNIYGYTSDAGGIRHALLDAPDIDFDDAKYMLVSCSAFINYLIGKCIKAGIELK